MPDNDQFLKNAEAIATLTERTQTLQGNVSTVFKRLDTFRNEVKDEITNIKVVIAEQPARLEKSLTKVVQDNMAYLAPKAEKKNGTGRFMAFLEHLTPLQALTYFFILLVIIAVTFGGMKVSDLLTSIVDDLGEVKTSVQVR